jgi:hypothetical protein
VFGIGRIISDYKSDKEAKLSVEQVYKKFTVDELKNIEDTWDMTQPMYWTVNIYGTYEEYLKSAEIFTLEQRYLLATTWYFLEVNNGGHWQFLENSTGIVWEDALNGFQLFGMNELAQNLQKVADCFGGRIPYDRDMRCDRMQEWMQDETIEQLLEEADNLVYDYEGIYEDEYVRAHPEKFVFEGCYEMS